MVEHIGRAWAHPHWRWQERQATIDTDGSEARAPGRQHRPSHQWSPGKNIALRAALQDRSRTERSLRETGYCRDLGMWWPDPDHMTGLEMEKEVWNGKRSGGRNPTDIV